MKRDSWRVSMAVVGAVIGAGFASGREISTFFARFGQWSWLGIICAITVMTLTLECIKQTPVGYAWRVLFGMLTAVTGGAMLACAGEIAALALPVHGAYTIGVVMLVVMVLWAGGRIGVLAGVSRLLTLLLLALLMSGFFYPGEGTALRKDVDLPQAMLSGLCYGGFNAALAVPVIVEAGNNRPKSVLPRISCIMFFILAVGNGVMLHHPELQTQAMPLIRLAGRYSKVGYYACCLTMGLAVLTTAIAADKGLYGVLPEHCRMLSPCLMLLVAMLGFRQVVAWLYPAVGAACFLTLLVEGAKQRARERG